MLNIDAKKLENHIMEGVDAVTFDGCIAETTCIGKMTFNGRRVQVHLTVTRDADDFMDDVPKQHICVTKAKMKMTEAV